MERYLRGIGAEVNQPRSYGIAGRRRAAATIQGQNDNMEPDSRAHRGNGGIDRLLRELAPQVLAVLVRRHGRFDACEDAVQEALLAAALQWPVDGVPDRPRGWLIAVATRRLIDELRSERARQARERAASGEMAPAPGPDVDRSGHDDALTLLFLCCHPALTPVSQLALTLRAVGGLTTAQIANALMVPEATMAQRISRAKQTIKASEVGFEMPPAGDWPARLAVVLHVLYLIFNEGYLASSGPALQRIELADEAIRLTRLLHRMLPDDGEVTGMLALMLLTHARRRARTRTGADLIPLVEQDRDLWDREMIDEGIALITASLSVASLGPYQLQAAIAAVHAEAPRAQDTDWPQVLKLYELLELASPNPNVTLNRAVAVAMVQGPQAGLRLLAELEESAEPAGRHRLESVRAHMLEMAGHRERAADSFRLAARLTSSLPERRYLEARAGAARTTSPPTS
jgi:RNA polymerase sigma factor (sigma-70 family)